jgi:hypothetical protein
MFAIGERDFCLIDRVTRYSGLIFSVWIGAITTRRCSTPTAC